MMDSSPNTKMVAASQTYLEKGSIRLLSLTSDMSCIYVHMIFNILLCLLSLFCLIFQVRWQPMMSTVLTCNPSRTPRPADLSALRYYANADITTLNSQNKWQCSRHGHWEEDLDWCDTGSRVWLAILTCVLRSGTHPDTYVLDSLCARTHEVEVDNFTVTQHIRSSNNDNMEFSLCAHESILYIELLDTYPIVLRTMTIQQMRGDECEMACSRGLCSLKQITVYTLIKPWHNTVRTMRLQQMYMDGIMCDNDFLVYICNEMRSNNASEKQPDRDINDYIMDYGEDHWIVYKCTHELIVIEMDLYSDNQYEKYNKLFYKTDSSIVIMLCDV